MLQVFRIEHTTTKIGPFQTNDEFTQELAAKAIACPILKSPGDDGLPLGYIPFSFVFGCLDVATLKKWFMFGDASPEHMQVVQTLREKGFHLAEFLVEEGDYQVSTSGVQVAFDAANCRYEGLVQYHDLASLLH